MQRSTLAVRLVFAALVCFGALLWAGSASAQEGNVVQGQNGSTDSIATSDTASANNSLTFGAGPAAGADGAPAQAAQNGDNVGAASQGAAAQSGDASAGSQVHGVVGSGATIQAQNASDGATAFSGPVTAENDLDVHLGPQANTAGATAPAQASQVGDNRLDASQTVTAASGDAVAGSQVTGIVGDGESTVQVQNTAEDPLAISGAVDAANIGDVIAGPLAVATDAGEAQASQVGDNDAVLTQSNVAASGDSVAGSQVTGIVGDGESTVQGQNTSEGAFSFSGFVESFNVAVAVEVGPVAAAGIGEAQASQIGDNAAVVDQDTQAGSGDAVAGSQVTGLVSSEAGHLTVQNQQSSDGDAAFSGDVGINSNMNTVAGVNVGPVAFTGDESAQASQTGDNALVIEQSADVASGDAVAGSQVTGVVGGDATIQNQNDSTDAFAQSGDVAIDSFVNDVFGATVGPLALSTFGEATASQVGDNALTIEQAAVLASGDAVAGSQVTGVVANSSATIQNQNVSDDAVALTGFVAEFSTVNSVADAVTGPVADAFDGAASSVQDGDNDALVVQSADLWSGDAVAGSQVTGVVVSGGDVTIQNQNAADAPFALSGDVAVDTTVNAVDLLTVGPEALADTSDASAAQVGDNTVEIVQVAVAASGDAVAGSQVTGVVASGGDVTVQNQNDSTDAEAITGGAEANNTAFAVNVGPLAIGDGDVASAQQVGDDELVLAQDASAMSGDAVAGAQVVGAVQDDTVVQLQNLDDASIAETFDAFADNFASGNVGPFASALVGNADAQQIGDSAFIADQSGDARTGDAVAGGQVTGLVGSIAGTLAVSGGLSAEEASEAGSSFEIATAAAV